jgi:hypothetical protein
MSRLATDPPYIRLSVVERIEPFALHEAVSEVARSARGFLAAYKLASGEPILMGREPKSQKPWSMVRRNFINRHLLQASKVEKSFWLPSGQPTRRHLMLLMWAYTPTTEQTAAWVRSLPQRR